MCAAVYLNWSYGQKGEEAETISEAVNSETATSPQPESDSETDDSDAAGLYYEESGGEMTENVAEYFDQVRLNRQQARDEAAATLETVSTAEGASQETIDQALSEMAVMAQWAVTESEIENLIMAKGYSECVAYISNDGITVTVPAPEEGLSSSAVARITEAVTEETDFSAADLKIVEIK